MKKANENVSDILLTVDELVPIVKETFDSGLPFVLSVSGCSMRPTLNTKGDKVELLSVTKRPVAKGCIILFKRKNGGCILHRVIKICGDKLTVNGDAQVYTEQISASQIIGVANRLYRHGRWIDCDSFFYRLYSKMWMSTLFFRKVYFKLCAIIKNK